MAANRSEHLGVPRHGPALLSGFWSAAVAAIACSPSITTTAALCAISVPLSRPPTALRCASPWPGVRWTTMSPILCSRRSRLLPWETSLRLAEDLELERAEHHRQLEAAPGACTL